MSNDKKAQVEQLEHWISSPSVSVDKNGLRDTLAQSLSRDCVQGADSRTTDLSSEQKDLLLSALSQILGSYVQSDVDSFLTFLRSQNEQTVQQFDSQFRSILTGELGFEADEVDTWDWDHVLREYWSKADVGSGWKSIHGPECCSWYWKASSFQEAAAEPSLFVKSAQLFKNQTTFPHLFYSESTNVDFVERDGHLLVADIWVVVSHTDEQLAGTSPYMLRLWFEPGPNVWRPMLMIHIDTMGESSPTLIF